MLVVPTPFNHIVLAERILSEPALPTEQRELLEAQRPAFLLGNTAPDLGSISGYPRHQTHFFRVPILRNQPAHLRLLTRHPELQNTQHLPSAQAAFVAGYLAHLWLDQAWILHVFQPFFAQKFHSASFHDRLIEHNLVRAHLDRQQREQLPADLGSVLAAATPSGWLPFAPDEMIARWRDHLVEQLAPGSHIQTIEVFAKRLDLTASQFAHRLNSDDDLQKAFSRLPPNHLKSFRKVALAHSLELVRYYLGSRAESAPKSSLPVQQLEVNPGHGETTP